MSHRKRIRGPSDPLLEGIDLATQLHDLAQKVRECAREVSDCRLEIQGIATGVNPLDGADSPGG